MSVIADMQVLGAGKTTAVALTEGYLARIAQRNPTLNAFWAVDANGALAQAQASDVRRARGECLSDIDGITIGVKDNIDVANLPCTGGMATRRGQIALTDAFVVQRLRAAGAVILGKLSLHEAALGADNDNPHFGACHNPHRQGYTPGGSSGGSGAAVSADLCAGALGTDTMGSARIPAAYCGVAGFKPSYGVLSQRGLMPACPRLDHVGILARTARDVAPIYAAINAFDANDPYARCMPNVALANPLRMGVLQDLGAHGVSEQVNAAFGASVKLLAAHMAIIPVHITDADFGKDRRAGLLATEADMAHFHRADLANRPELFSPTLLAMLRFGQSKSAPDLAAAIGHIERAGLRARALFAAYGIDVLLCPTTPQTAFAFGQAAPANQADLTSMANFAGLPAISIPGGIAAGLPVGVQLMMPLGADLALLALAARIEVSCCFVCQGKQNWLRRA
jgi:Asp-tRNA(Asn)/Glu-tRNA(Gln) amidotransferase A subunit family amidase